MADHKKAQCMVNYLDKNYGCSVAQQYTMSAIEDIFSRLLSSLNFRFETEARHCYGAESYDNIKRKGWEMRIVKWIILIGLMGFNYEVLDL